MCGAAGVCTIETAAQNYRKSRGSFERIIGIQLNPNLSQRRTSVVSGLTAKIWQEPNSALYTPSLFALECSRSFHWLHLSILVKTTIDRPISPEMGFTNARLGS